LYFESIEFAQSAGGIQIPHVKIQPKRSGGRYLATMKRLMFLFCMASFTMYAQPIKVMTYNIRLDVASDGINQWSNRTEKLPALIRKYDPDLIGLQEAMHHQLMTILAALPGYDFIGVGRDDGKEMGEYSAILYRKSRFDVISQKTSWLSETPGVPGSKSWDAAITRVVTYGRFKDKASGKTFLYFNTHFDHIGKEARKRSSMLIKKLIVSERLAASVPVIVTGDFNSEPGDDAYKELLNTNLLVDSRPADSNEGTFCTFEVNGPPCRLIDYIFHSHALKVKEYLVIKDNDGKYYPSDHLPVMVELEW
jgi:endonuclease/exonuclease/phosphatase family metal-dependent hydrolase